MNPLEQYLGHLRSVRGWLEPDSARIISDLSGVQQAHDVTGGVGEIGVKWGRLFILLKLSAAPDERCFAIDNFEDRIHEQFVNNVQKWTGDTDFTLWRRVSGDVSEHEIVDQVGRCRLVSVDGGHEEGVVASDMQLVESVLAPGGVVIVDDFFNPRWPGVAAGVSRHLLLGGSRLRAFAISPGKTYLTTPEHTHRYRTALLDQHEGSLDHVLDMFGEQVAVFTASEQPSMGAGFRAMLRASPIGPQARRMRRRVRAALR